MNHLPMHTFTGRTFIIGMVIRQMKWCHGCRLAVKSGTISSCLTENSAFKVYSTPDPAQGKLSQTEYAVLKEARGKRLTFGTRIPDYFIRLVGSIELPEAAPAGTPTKDTP